MCFDMIETGDRVVVHGNTIGTGLPRYLEGSPMIVTGFTRSGKAVCDYDGGKPFRVPLSMLKKLKE